MSDELVTLKLSRLVPDPENVNQHNELNVAHIKASIQRFGFLDPIGVVKHASKRGAYMIVEGHGRYEAARELELTEAPCLVLSMSEAERRGYAIAHNQTQQIAKIDQHMVAAEFERLDVSQDDYVSLGYSTEDVLFLPDTHNHPQPDGIGGTQGTHGGQGAESTVVNGNEGEEADKAAGGFAPHVYRTSLTFSSELSYNRFTHVLTALRGRYPLAGTIGERVIALLKDINKIPTEA